MNYIGLFFIARLIFYVFVPSEILSFESATNIFRPIDIFFPVFGLEVAAILLKGGTSLERAKKLFLLPPLYFLVPLFVLLLSSLVAGNYTSKAEVFDLLILILEVIFLLYTVIFSLTITIDFPKSGRKIFELHIFALITIVLGILTIQMPQENLFFNLAHSLPFLWASIRFKPKNLK